MDDYNTRIEVKPADDDVLLLEVYSLDNTPGDLLGTDQFDLLDTQAEEPNFSFESLFVSAPFGECIGSVKMIGGSTTFPNSVFYDSMMWSPADSLIDVQVKIQNF